MITRAVQLAAFFYVVYSVGRGMLGWAFWPRAGIVRRDQEIRADILATIRGTGVHIYLLGASALVAWNWARLAWVWLVIGVLLCLLGMIAVTAGWFMRAHRELVPSPPAVLSEEQIQREVSSGRRIPLANGALLAVWVYAWWGVLRDVVREVL